jgi:hypothetical protein
MKVRLIKAGTSPPAGKLKPPPDEIEIADTLRSWVHEFKSDKANKPRMDFPGTVNTEKIKSPVADA